MATDIVRGWSATGSPPLAASIGVFCQIFVGMGLGDLHISHVSNQFGHRIGRKIFLFTLLSSMLFVAECFDSPDGVARILAADHGP